MPEKKDYKFDATTDAVDMKYASWDKVGQQYVGVLCAVRKNDIPDKWKHKKMEYILQTPEGERLCVQGRNYPSKASVIGDDYKIIYGMSEIPLGAIMAFAYTEDRPTDDGQPAKIIKPLYKGVRDEKTLKEYQERWGSVTVVTGSPEMELKDTGEEIDLSEIK